MRDEAFRNMCCGNIGFGIYCDKFFDRRVPNTCQGYESTEIGKFIIMYCHSFSKNTSTLVFEPELLNKYFYLQFENISPFAMKQATKINFASCACPVKPVPV